MISLTHTHHALTFILFSLNNKNGTTNATVFVQCDLSSTHETKMYKKVLDIKN